MFQFLLYSMSDTLALSKKLENISEKVLDNTLDSVIQYLPRFIFTVIMFLILWKLIGLLSKGVKKILIKRDVDVSVAAFITMITSIALKLILFIAIIKELGLEVSSLVAMIGAMGLAIGLAMQGTLQNLAGGVIILILKPFRTGDDVEFGGERGIVKVVQLFNTVIEKHGTNENMIVPNSAISSSTLINWTRDRNRRIDIPFGVAYGTDLKFTKEIIIAEANKDERVIEKNQTMVLVTSLADSSINMELRVLCDPTEFLRLRSDMVEMIYNTLNQHNIDIPFPQLTINNKQ